MRPLAVWSPGFVVATTVRRSVAAALALVGGLALAVRPATAQQPPPMPGTTGSMGIEGTLEPLSAGVDTIVVKTVDGAKHVFRYTKDLLVHGGKGTGVPSLQGLREGSTVVVHYTGTGADTTALEIDRFGDDGLKVTEGVITRVDRGRKQIVLKFDSGKTETFELTDRAAKDVGKDVDRAASATTRVAVYYVDEAGRRVVHYFKKVS